MKTILAVLSLARFAALALPVGAQEVLPRPEQPFGGKLGRATKDFPKMVETPKGTLAKINLKPANLATREEQKLKEAHAAIAVAQ